MMKKEWSGELFFSRVTDYLDTYLTKALSRSKHTVESYRDALTIFRRFLSVNKGMSITRFKVTDLTVEIVLDYISYLKKDYESSTINQRVTVIKSYMKYIAECDNTYLGIYTKISHIPPIKVSKLIRPVLDENMLSQIIECAGEDRKGIRNQMMMIILYDCAVRVSELINIRMNDIDTKNGVKIIYIAGKGDKERIIVLSTRATEHLNNYIRLYHSNNESEYLFYTIINNQVNHISASSVQKIIKKVAKRLKERNLDLPESVHPHIFRRSRATHLYQSGIPLEQISRMLGHSEIDTTKIYAKMSIEQMREIIEIDSNSIEEPEWNDEDEIIKMFGLR